MPIELAVNQRTFLKSKAQLLKAVVWIGKNGLNEEVLSAIDKALEVDELIKVKVHESAPVDRKKVGFAIAEELNCAFVQNIGRIVVLYRPFAEKPELKLPEAKKAK